MISWLHWVEKTHYQSTSMFIAEAYEQGISRHISLDDAGEMSWGDVVSCLYNINRDKGGTLFVEFRIDRITGLTSDAMAFLTEELELQAVDFGGMLVRRASGEYLTGLTYACDGFLSWVIAALEKAQEEGIEIGDPMIACDPGGIISVEENSLVRPFPVFSDMSIWQGFRKYNRGKAMAEMFVQRSTDPEKRLRLKGEYLTHDNQQRQYASIGIDPTVQTVHNYQKAG